MKVLFIGGTGIITTDTARLAIARGYDVTLLNRGTSKLVPEGARQLHADVYDRNALERVLGDESFDVILDCISYTPSELRYKLDMLRGRYQQFVFISSTAVYARGVELPITENSMIGNFGWNYGYNKAACEHELAREDFLYGCTYTIVRPSETYHDLRVPMPIVANVYNGGYTMLNRIRLGKPVIVHDDGLAQAPFTHATDIAKGIVGLFMNSQAYGEAFHITTDEVHSWREVTEMVGDAVGTKANIVYVPTRELCLAMPDTPHGNTYGVFVCAKMHDACFDNSKIRSIVPDFECTVTLVEGLRRTVAFYDEHPEYKKINAELDAEMDRVCALFMER
jgi:nucleoside-diphosphate-sugar epimerase